MNAENEHQDYKAFKDLVASGSVDNDFEINETTLIGIRKEVEVVRKYTAGMEQVLAEESRLKNDLIGFAEVTPVSAMNNIMQTVRYHVFNLYFYVTKRVSLCEALRLEGQEIDEQARFAERKYEQAQYFLEQCKSLKENPRNTSSDLIDEGIGLFSEAISKYQRILHIHKNIQNIRREGAELAFGITSKQSTENAEYKS